MRKTFELKFNFIINKISFLLYFDVLFYGEK